eukprot:510698_1
MVSKVTGAFSVKDTLPSAFHNTKTQWRKSDCKYVTNEIKIDIIEAIDCILQASAAFKAKAITSFINGSLECSVKLSGEPDLSLNFNNARVINHVQLHRCIRISRWQKEQIISFVPPDGKFTLMKYRIPNAGQLPLEITPNIKLNKSHSTVKIEINKSMNVDKTIDKILLEIPFPAETLSFTLSATDCKSWNSCYAFEIKGLSLSNLRVDSLAVHNVKYKPFKGVRHITKAGTYLIRCT